MLPGANMLVSAFLVLAQLTKSILWRAAGLTAKGSWQSNLAEGFLEQQATGRFREQTLIQMVGFRFRFWGWFWFWV